MYVNEYIYIYIYIYIYAHFRIFNVSQATILDETFQGSKAKKKKNYEIFSFVDC